MAVVAALHRRSFTKTAGQAAQAPTEIPFRGWTEIALRTVRAFAERNLSTLAAGVAFYAAVSVIPALSAAAALYVGLGTAEAGIGQIGALRGLAPDDALDLLSVQITRIAALPKGQLLWIGLAGSVAALTSLNAAVMALMTALNLAYGVREERPLLRRLLVSASFTLAAAVTGPATFAALLIGRRWGQGLAAPAALVAPVRFAFVALVAGAALAALYRYGPSRTLARWRWVTPGGSAAALAWLISSAAASYYFGRLANYQHLYGVIGAVLVVMGWLWSGAFVVLLGAGLNAELESQTDRDTTVAGRP